MSEGGSLRGGSSDGRSEAEVASEHGSSPCDGTRRPITPLESLLPAGAVVSSVSSPTLKLLIRASS